MYSFPNLEPDCCPMSSSNSCFLTCTQISQEVGEMVWYSHLLKNFPLFVVIHTVKGFGIVNKAEEDVFLELSWLFNDPADFGSLISGSSAFSKSSSRFMYGWSLAWRILSITLLDCEMSVVVWTSLALPFFGIGMKTDLFQSCGHCRVFQICWHIECSTFTALSFRILNSSTGIPSPPLALFIVTLPKAHLISHSRLSGSRVWLSSQDGLPGLSMRDVWLLRRYFLACFPCKHEAASVCLLRICEVTFPPLSHSSLLLPRRESPRKQGKEMPIVSTRFFPIDLINPKGNQCWIFIGRTGAETSSNSLATWFQEPTHWKRPWCWEKLKAKGEEGNRRWDG